MASAGSQKGSPEDLVPPTMVRDHPQEKSLLRSWIEEDILYLHADDVPPYKKQGSIVRNSFFWALRSIAAQAPMGKAWEFESAVWFALQRMLTNFTDSGYLGTRETQLEFREDAVIPQLLQPMATWIPIAEFDQEPEPSRYGDDAAGRNWNSSNHHKHKQASFQRKAKQRSEPEPRPKPPYSSYINKKHP